MSYPATGLFNGSHAELALSLRDLRRYFGRELDDPDELLSALSAELRDGELPKAIISAEDLFLLSRSQVEKVYRHLSEFDVSVVCFIRRTDDYLLSLYNQNCKDIANDFKIHYRSALLAPMKTFAKATDVAGGLDRWSTTFGRENFHLFVLDEVQDVLGAILSVAGIPDKPSQEAAWINRSISYEMLEMIRTLKHVTNDVDVRRRVADLARSHIVRSTPLKNVPTREERVAVLENARTTNTAIFETYLKRPNAFASDALDFPEVKPHGFGPMLLTGLLCRVAEQQALS